MARPVFDVKEQVLGTGDTTAYTFNFKIEDPTYLLIVVWDNNGVEVQRVRGDDTTYLASLTFDPVNGGGTVTLAAFLPDTYSMVMFLANDVPSQPTQFLNRGAFTLQAFEMALDFITGAVQRLAYFAQRAMVLNDYDDAVAFNPTLPAGINNAAGYIPIVNATSTGWDWVPKQSIFTQIAKFTITDGQGVTALLGELIDSSLYSSVVYTFEIIRGTTVFSTGQFSLHYRNGTWYYVSWSDNSDASAANTGVTFSITGSTIAQLNAALDSGAGSGTLKLWKQKFTA